MYAHDGQFPKESLGDYPKVCAGSLQDGTVGYTFEIECGNYGTNDSASVSTGAAVGTYFTAPAPTPPAPTPTPPAPSPPGNSGKKRRRH